MTSDMLMTSLMLLLATSLVHGAIVMTTEEASMTAATAQSPSTQSTAVTALKNKFDCLKDHPHLEHGYYEVAMDASHVIKPRCHPGFLLVGGGDLVCNETEQRFMGKQSHCEDVDECSLMEYDDADDDDDDVISSATSEQDQEADEKYTFPNCHQEATCINNIGSYKCVCTNGFHGNGFVCNSKTEEKCSVPEPPSYGVIYPITPLNIRVLCHPDYSVHGRSIVKCQGGTWETLPKCIPGWKSCGDPGVPQNGFRKGNRYHEGAAVRFFCRRGFEIQGSRLRMCLEPDLKWTGSQPRCIEVPKERIEDGGQIPEKPKILHREKRI